jgi:predicted CXXCH cytochrome family protein
MVISKTLIRCLVITVSFVILQCGAVYAAISGNCANCHSTHNSQNGIALSSDGSQPSLQSATCWGCHAGGTANNIDSVTGAPQIRHTNAADLAGGNFAYITGDKSGISGDNKTRGHNIKDANVTDTNFSGGVYPPGDKHNNYAEGLNNTNFTCAGKFGCHGDRTIEDEYEAVKNAHHYNDSSLKFGSISIENQAVGGTTGEQVGSSYRFLKGVKGGEDPDWQATASVTDHNEYFGATSMRAGSRTVPAGNTISGFCAECHGFFHGNESIETGGSSSPWSRHPTDISLPGSGTEYAGYTTYSIDVPVARTMIPQSPSGSVNPSGTVDDIVMCLSCHRAHASPYEDLLRFNYADMIAGDSSKSGGCFTCHTSKN